MYEPGYWPGVGIFTAIKRHRLLRGFFFLHRAWSFVQANLVAALSMDIFKEVFNWF